MNELANKHILLGVSGGIAAYKAAELTRRLRGAGAQVRVVMTRGAQQFVTPLTFQALSGAAVRTELFDTQAEAAMGHIELARWADAIVIAPASANCLARLAHGQADDLLATLCLASNAPLFLAPAMNHVMWAHPATQANRALLEQRGAQCIGPADGEQACGEVGPGRMAEPEAIVAALAQALNAGALQGVRVLITAGPTREPIDPVRFISNRSAGKMGFALAVAAVAAGAQVTLVTGPVALITPRGVMRVEVETAAQMRAAVLAQVASCDIFIGAAAVADYRPAQPVAHKLKKTAARLELALERTADILAEVAAQRPRPTLVVGFAAETEQLLQNAQAKRQAKGIDLIIANAVGAGVGMETDDNAATACWDGGLQDFPRTAKTVLAQQLITLIASHYHATHQTKNP